MYKKKPTSRYGIPSHPIPPGKPIRFTPFHAILAGCIVVFLIIAFVVIRLISSNATTSPAPKASLETPTASEPMTSVALEPSVPPMTLTPIITPSPIPYPCTTLRDGLAYNEPKEQTIKRSIGGNYGVSVIGREEGEDKSWYRIIWNGVVYYLPVENVYCEKEN